MSKSAINVNPVEGLLFLLYDQYLSTRTVEWHKTFKRGIRATEGVDRLLNNTVHKSVAEISKNSKDVLRSVFRGIRYLTTSINKTLATKDIQWLKRLKKSPSIIFDIPAVSLSMHQMFLNIHRPERNPDK